MWKNIVIDTGSLVLTRLTTLKRFTIKSKMLALPKILVLQVFEGKLNLD